MFDILVEKNLLPVPSHWRNVLGGEALGLSPPKDVVAVLGFLWLETEVLSHITLCYLVLTKLYSECSSEFSLTDFHTPEEMVMLAS